MGRFRKVLSSLIPGFVRPRVGPMSTAGTGGTQIVGGMVVTAEKESSLVGTAKYAKFSENVVNTSIVGAAVRNFLNLCASVEWRVEPNVDGGAEAVEIAELIDEILRDMTTPWRRIVRKAVMYKLNGFATLEWTAKRREDGQVGFLDIESRPCHTIERWDVDESGTLHGFIQRDPNSMREIYLPRKKCLYLVDDSLTDSPEGLGIYRHLIEPIRKLRRYEQLEGIGYETDLKGIPIARAPLGQMQSEVEAGTLKETERDTRLTPITTFLGNHIKTPSMGMLLDSETFRTLDETQSPSAVRKWDLELITGEGSAPTAAAVGLAIQRIVRELARLLAAEHLLLGETGAGSLAMHKDKTNQFHQMIDGAVAETVETVEADLLVPIFALNGFDDRLMPTLKAASVSQREVAEVTAALRDLAASGVMLEPDEEAIGEVFDLVGLTRPKNPLGAHDLQLELAEAGGGPKGLDEEAEVEEDAEEKPEEKKPEPVKKWHRGRGRLGKSAQLRGGR